MNPRRYLERIASLASRGDLPAAMKLLDEGLRRHPAESALWISGAMLSNEAGDLATARRYIDRAVALNPGSADAWYCKGALAKSAGCADDAAAAYRRAIACDPRHFRAMDNLGNLLLGMGAAGDAAKLFESSASVNPLNPVAFNGMGLAARATGAFESAASSFRRATELRRDYFEAWTNYGNALRELGQAEASMAAHRTAIALQPGRPEAHNELGATLAGLRRTSEAVAEYREAIRLAPAFAEAHANLGAALLLQGELPEACEALSAALRLAPGNPVLHSNYLFALHYRDDVPAGAVLELARDYGRKFAGSLGPAPEHDNQPDPERKLRIGYVSADLRQHPIGFFLEPVLESHCRDSFQAYCYSGVARPDEVTARLREKCDEWRDTLQYDDAQLAARIRADRIDILVDLSGHTAGNRLLAFARKPAPIQATWMGYLDTTGLEAVDYLITDEWTAPASECGRGFVEQLWRLPEVYQAYRPPAYAPEVRDAPCLANGYVTFGCLNNLAKINDTVVRVWSEILARAPTARLLIQTNNLDDQAVVARTRERFARHGADTARLVLRGGLPHREFLGAYAAVDVALDPFPYSGGTSTCEALWMGVPVVKLLDQRFLSRFGASFIAAVGLRGLLAKDTGDYVRIATELAARPADVVALRGGLRERMAETTLCNGSRFTRQLEEAYREWWRIWCKRGPPGG